MHFLDRAILQFDLLHRTAPRLSVLASNAAHANNRCASSPNENEGERQYQTDLVGDVFLNKPVGELSRTGQG